MGRRLWPAVVKGRVAEGECGRERVVGGGEEDPLGVAERGNTLKTRGRECRVCGSRREERGGRASHLTLSDFWRRVDGECLQDRPFGTQQEATSMLAKGHDLCVL